MLLHIDILTVHNSYRCNPFILGMNTHLRFIVSHGGRFIHANDEWKWIGDKTTSILVSRNITLAGLLLRLNEKLGFIDPHTEMKLKFKVPNMSIPPAEIREDEDIMWYISVHTATALCVNIVERNMRTVDMGRDTNLRDHLFAATDVHQNLEHDDMNHEPSSPVNNTVETRNFDDGAAPVDDMLDDPFNGKDAASIADVDTQMSSQLIRSGTDQWITAVDTSDLVERQIILSKKELYSKIRVLALQGKFEFYVSRSSRKMLTVACVDRNCKWMIRASSVKQTSIFMIRKFNHVHTCSVDIRRNAH